MEEEEEEEEDVLLRWSLKGTSRYCTWEVTQFSHVPNEFIHHLISPNSEIPDIRLWSNRAGLGSIVNRILFHLYKLIH
jgi:hypothetical protein